ncbi:MAG: PAS domain S-box protein [Conexivisphaerales archaeon]
MESLHSLIRYVQRHSHLLEPNALLLLWLSISVAFFVSCDLLVLGNVADRSFALWLTVALDLLYTIASGISVLLLARRYVRKVHAADDSKEATSHTLRTFLDASPLAVASTDLFGHLESWNPPAERIFGWKREEVLGKADPTLPAEPLAGLTSDLLKAFVGEGTYNSEQVRRNKGGTNIDVLVTTLPVRDGSGRLWGAIEVMEDISERKLERAALIDTARSFKSAFEDAAVGMAMTGLDGRWMKVNRALCETLGYTEEELLSKTFEEVTYAEDRDVNSDLGLRLREGKLGSYQIEKRYVRKDGKVIWATLSVSVVRDAGGQPLYSISQVEDVTARKEAEDELKSYSVGLEKKVKERTEELEKTNQLLVQSERLAAIGSLAAQVAHDLRNPLTAINTNLFYIKNVLPGDLGDKVGDSIGSVERAVEHSSKIIDDLLQYSRATDLNTERLDFGSALEQFADGLDLPRSVKLVRNLEAGAFIDGDLAKLKRVFQNLVSNAVEAMPSGGTLSLSVRADADKVVAEVADTGVGMDSTTLRQLFNPFFTTKAKGLGLGLAICQRLVEAHGGKINISSEEGKGTSAVITLPRAPDVESSR